MPKFAVSITTTSYIEFFSQNDESAEDEVEEMAKWALTHQGFAPVNTENIEVTEIEGQEIPAPSHPTRV